MEVEEFLEESTGLVLALEELRKDLPQLEQMSSDVKSDLENFNKNIEQVKETINVDKIQLQRLENDCDSLIKQIKNEQIKFQSVLSSIEQNLKKINETKEHILSIKQETDTQLKKFELKINELENKIKNLPESKIVHFDSNQTKNVKTKKTSTKEEKNKNVKNASTLSNDYNTARTIKYLYNKYKNTDIPIIVKRIEGVKWSSDYVFIVNSISNTSAHGAIYKKGIYLKSESRPLNTSEYCLYDNQEYINMILLDNKK